MTYSAAAVGIHAMLDLDTHGEVAETLLYMLTEPTDVEPDGPYYPALALLFPATEPGELAGLRAAVDLCPLHGCDAQICADDNNPECAHLRTATDPEE